MNFVFFILIIFLTPFLVSAQQYPDSISEKTLTEVIIRAFDQNRKLKDVPASINYVGRSEMERYGTVSVLQAINSTPGVRMEERSPGSYRINIRGSAIRSPFGVRNVKVYFNSIPITDPGGQTYFNQLGYYNFNSVEVIKGPGSSLYGAGTGGVLLIESLNRNDEAGASAEFTAGSYQLRNTYASVTTKTEKLVSRTGFQHQLSNGFRNHSALKRTVLSWTGQYQINENRRLSTSFLYGDLFYETPGALTSAEFAIDRKASRPGTGVFPSAVAAKASISQRTFLAGASFWQQLNTRWQSTNVLYGMFTELRNPAIRNYGKSSDPHFGGRSIFKYINKGDKAEVQLNLGGEWQVGYSSVSIHKNLGGEADSLQTYDEITNRQSLLFSQVSIDFPRWTIVAGSSLNWLNIKFQRFMPNTFGKQNKKFNNTLSPRLAIMRKMGTFNFYSSISKGFSPPTTSELLPSGSAINLDLNAEEGINIDLGAKGNIKILQFDINVFRFSLQRTIVQRRDAGGGELFINAGKTSQHGIETYVKIPFNFSAGVVESTLFWLSHTWHDFHYKEFKQLTNDFSGNKIPGIPPHVISSGLDVEILNGFMANVNWFFSGKVPLNDANSFYATSYHLVGVKIGYQKLINRWKFKLTAGAENILNEKYSLGNDINGFGGRFFNAAQGRNYFASIRIQWLSRKNE